MDSGNSGSLQSSSGGDDELDSRCGADSSPLSALLRQPPPPPSVPGFGVVGGGGSLIYGLQELRTPPLSSHWCSTTAPLPAGAEASASPPSLPGHGAAAATAADQGDAAPAQAPAPPRGSRKRARASRRAPTTVLTTDTSNFRAMVQEFTGIPTPPFAAGGATATARSRFDHHLFPLRTTATAAAGTASPATLPQYLLRPFAQKVQVQVHASSATPYPPSFTSPSTSSPGPDNISIAPASTTTPGTTTALASSSDSYHQLTAASTTSALLGTMKQDQFHGSNNYHSFQQSSSLGDGKYAAHPVFDRGIAPPPPLSATRLHYPAEFLGLTHDDVMVSSQGPHAHAHFHPRNGGDELSGLVGGASVTGAAGCKATYNSSTRPLLERNRRNPSADISTATATTAPAAATAGMRTQAGVVDSWVCTSD